MSSVTEVGQLVVRERQCRVRMLAAELLACFHEDATVETSWSEGSAAAFVSGTATRSASSGPIINRVGPPVVEVHGQRAFVELPSTTTRWIPVNGVEAVLVSFMRLLYRVEQRAGAWKISSLHAVNEGDTLFTIARYELGKATRWAEIYDLNREALGEDFDYLRPGMELVMPARGTEAASQPADSRY